MTQISAKINQRSDWWLKKSVGKKNNIEIIIDGEKIKRSDWWLKKFVKTNDNEIMIEIKEKLINFSIYVLISESTFFWCQSEIYTFWYSTIYDF